MRFSKITWALPFFALLLAGCEGDGLATPDPSLSGRDQEFLALAPKADIPSQFQRYEVADPTGEKPGTVVVDTKHMYLYYVLPGGKAMRYGIAAGSEAAGWTGTATIGRKEEWPHWMPPSDMLKRWPHLQPTADAGGLPGGPAIRSARGRCICSRATRTRSTASTAPTSRSRSARRYPRAASVCRTSTRLTSTTVSRSAPRSLLNKQIIKV